MPIVCFTYIHTYSMYVRMYTYYIHISNTVQYLMHSNFHRLVAMSENFKPLSCAMTKMAAKKQGSSRSTAAPSLFSLMASIHKQRKFTSIKG